MSDSKSDPYATPRSSIERGFGADGAGAYRDGADFIARAGYEAPRVCVRTGERVGEGVKDVRVLMKPKWTLSSWIFVILVVVVVFYFVQLENDFLVGMYLLVIFVAAFLFGRWQKARMDAVSVYCISEVRRKWVLRQFCGNSLLISGVVLMNVHLFTNFSARASVAGFGLLYLGIFLLHKKLLKSKGREGDYECFEGAHGRFLEAVESRTYSHGLTKDGH